MDRIQRLVRYRIDSWIFISHWPSEVHPLLRTLIFPRHFLSGVASFFVPHLSFYPHRAYRAPSHQEVQYSREGKSKEEVPENTLAVFRFVKKAFVIPNDFEKDHKVQL